MLHSLGVLKKKVLPKHIFLSVLLLVSFSCASAEPIGYPFPEAALQKLANKMARRADISLIPEELNGDRTRYAEYLYLEMLKTRDYIATLPEKEQLEIRQSMIQMHKGVHPEEAGVQVWADLKKKQENNVIQHFKGSQSQPLPSAEKLKLLEENYRESKKSETLPIKLPNETSLDKTKIDLIRFPNCKASGSQHDGKEDGLNTKPEEVLFDVIFVNEKPEELDAAEVFGLKAKVVEVSENISDHATRAALVMGVQCLPTRLRRTVHGRSWMEGRNALLNYDKKPRGELHQLVAEFYEIGKTSKGR